jgi:hypothetical protein
MTFAAVILVGASLGQPASPTAAPNYYPMNSRKIALPITYDKDRKSIRQIKLYVARNGENTWYQELAAPPTQEQFTYVAKEDGLYWFTIVEEDMQGKNNPADLTRTPPDMKVLVDTVQPRVQFTNARKTGDEVVVEWYIDDKNPDESKTQVHFRASGSDGYWQEVTLPANSRSGVRFPVGGLSNVSVRVTAYDLAGNKTEAIREIGANTTTSLSPNTQANTTPPAGALPPPDFGNPVGPVPPSPAPGQPAAPTMPASPGGNALAQGPIAPVMPAAPVTPPSPPVAFNSPAPIQPQVQPLATVDPRTALVPAGPVPSSGGPTPVAVWTGVPNTTSPTVEVTRAQYINYLTFDMGYEVESRGPSGISRLDLWVTRDDGRTWMKWSQHDGKLPSVRVNLNVPTNSFPEGSYGFRVVPVSGAGLSEREPVAGDAPDLRVVVDVTPPTLDLFPPTGDPGNPDTLVVQWKATDRNFGEDPITIEWSDRPTGPWQPAAAAEVLQTGVGQMPQPAQAKRLPNTGQFPWRVPAGLPPRVYLKVSARDAAGNVKEVITREPILVDLVKPRAKISGIVTPAGGIVRP